MSIGNIQLTAAYMPVIRKTYVWREKIIWWKSLCTNKLTISPETKVSTGGPRYTIGGVLDDRPFVEGQILSFGSYGDNISDICEVFIKPSGV